MSAEWRIFYDDSTNYQGPVDDAPGFGVVCIAQKDTAGGINMASHGDYYVLINDFWVICDTFGVLDYMINSPKSVQRVLAGRTISKDDFHRIYKLARTMGYE